jgi:hypothetical protein
MENYGAIPGIHFNLGKTFSECDKRPLDNSFRDPGSDSYSRTLPFIACGYNAEFYLQITLNEYAFSPYSEAHKHKSTGLLVAREPKRKRFVQEFGKALPVIVCSIIVNRDEFDPIQEGEDEIEWLTKLTLRTAGIAHELFYAVQYLEKYNWATSTEERPSYTSAIVKPDVDAEKKLLCPDKQIERYLQGIEQQRGIRIESSTQFRDHQGTLVIENYYRAWLQNQVVERTIVHDRTIEFLENHNRMQLPHAIRDALQATFPKEKLDWDGFVNARMKNSEHYDFFLQTVRQNGHIDEELIHIHVEQILKSQKAVF